MQFRRLDADLCAPIPACAMFKGLSALSASGSRRMAAMLRASNDRSPPKFNYGETFTEWALVVRDAASLSDFDCAA